MTCDICRRSQKDGFYNAVKCKGLEYVDECPRPDDRIPKLSEENHWFKRLFDKMLPGLIDPSGSFLFDAIGFVFDIYQVPEGQRPILFDKCLIVISAIQETRNKN